ncbi:anthranilate synthase component I family protein [Nesterenkonia sp. HG001]|uniref:anthranilate synthase component I family protein n=1 Tax=Nesterenkonia sp. HG001 TaxID=2983207 RepID=UPI002AC6B447|nr:anthranilate synthase component I family protein [Nesterenkonia sp. HG001]MDZ5077525.1 anthranilate synthase component I family protein [Nesterenkonia sp. HG001]
MDESQRTGVGDLPTVHRHRLAAALPEDAAILLFERLSATMPTAPAALLDSSDHARTAAPERSRRSILAFSAGPCALEVRHHDGVTVEHHPDHSQQPRRRTEGPFFSWLRQAWPHKGSPAGPAETQGSGEGPAEPFQLGWLGWLGYELRREVGSPDLPSPDLPSPERASPEPGPRGHNVQDAGAPSEAPDDAHLFRATHAVVIDHAADQVEIQSLGADPDWRNHVTQLVAAIATEDAVVPASPAPHLREMRVRDTRREHLAAIAEAQREIYDGNTYEACLTTAVTGLAAAAEADPMALFRRLRATNRAPFTQLLRLGPGRRDPAPEGEGRPQAERQGVDVVSTSPERYLSIDVAGTVRSEPIKGTRPRGEDPEADVALREDLAAHPKDRAENVMITDLVRNDLSIHAIPGTLRTERLCAVESYPTVHQMVSTVSARISPEAARADVVAAAFPPGSMTGAPKISTMDILQRLETGRRGPYSGVAGYFSTTGAADLSVLIRTLVISAQAQDDVVGLHLGLGGAIVADSDPEAEWDEVVTKSAGVLGALGAEFPHR